jgi:hypothetical protein
MKNSGNSKAISQQVIRFHSCKSYPHKLEI